MYQKLSHKVPQTGTLKMGGGGGSLDCSFGKTGDEIKSGDENSANKGTKLVVSYRLVFT